MAKKANAEEQANQDYKKSLKSSNEGKNGKEKPDKPEPGSGNNKNKNKPNPPPDNPDDSSDYKWPGPQPWGGLGPPPADSVAERGTKEWRQAVKARQDWAVDQAWSEQVGNGLNLSDDAALKNFLATIGITDEQGGGRHLLNLLLGNLPESEGGGRNPDPNRDISWMLENHMPDWKIGVDKAIQGGHLIKDHETGLLVNPTPGNGMPRWYDNFGREVAAPYAGRWHGDSAYVAEQNHQAAASTAPGITFDTKPITPPASAPVPFNPSPWSMPAYTAQYPAGTPRVPTTKTGDVYGQDPVKPAPSKLVPIKQTSSPWDESGMPNGANVNGLDPIGDSRPRRSRTPDWYSTTWRY